MGPQKKHRHRAAEEEAVVILTLHGKDAIKWA